MTTPAQARYLADSVTTASPARLLVMLYDRLVVDLSQAEEALRGGDRETGGDRLMHAQEIVMELRGSLDLEVWDGAPGLAALYGFLIGELIKANVRADADLTATCRLLVEPLRDAWREAAQTAPAVPATPAASALAA